MMTTKHNLWDKVKALLWIIAGLIVIFFVVQTGIDMLQVMQGSGKISARVGDTYDDDREEYDGRRVGTVTVAAYEFFVDGRRYAGSTEGYKGKWIVGDEIIVEYNRNNPKQNRAENDRKPVVDYFFVVLFGGMFSYYCLKLNLPVFYTISVSIKKV